MTTCPDNRCTGLTASWCPIHGDCICPRNENHGDFDEGMDEYACPLHGIHSKHPLPLRG